MPLFKKIIILFFILASKQHVVFSQCTPVGPLTPSGVTNNTSIGSVGWGGMSNLTVSDNTYVSAGSLLGILGSAQSNYMVTKGYGFSIPLAANICGIQVDIERNATGLLIGSSVKDNAIYLLNAGALTGSNMASGTSWPASDATAAYGGSGTLWGGSWTPADINNPNFGVAISTQMNAGLASLFLSANIDQITITVFYKIPTLPIEIVSFKGHIEVDKVKLEWQTASEINNRYFSVEKMNEKYEWSMIARLNGAGNSTGFSNYQIYDTSPEKINYYRLKQTDYSNSFSYSPVISVEYDPKKSYDITLYPNPATTWLTIKTADRIEKIEIISDNGAISVPEIIYEEDLKINVNALAEGIYILKIYTPGNVVTKKFTKTN